MIKGKYLSLAIAASAFAITAPGIGTADTIDPASPQLFAQAGGSGGSGTGGTTGGGTGTSNRGATGGSGSGSSGSMGTSPGGGSGGMGSGAGGSGTGMGGSTTSPGASGSMGAGPDRCANITDMTARQQCLERERNK